MKIGIDARWIFPQISGIGMYTQELIRGLAQIDRRNEYVLFFDDESRMRKIAERVRLDQAPNFKTHLLPFGVFSPLRPDPLSANHPKAWPGPFPLAELHDAVTGISATPPRPHALCGDDPRPHSPALSAIHAKGAQDAAVPRVQTPDDRGRRARRRDPHGQRVVAARRHRAPRDSGGAARRCHRRAERRGAGVHACGEKTRRRKVDSLRRPIRSV